ncbi:MAPEG family protein [Chitinibacteraceae bacterium HSL-7]
MTPVLHSLLLPMTVHFVLAALLYTVLTIARAPAVWGIGRATDDSNPWAPYEPRISANLSNQFEWPVFFHIACVLLISAPASPLALTLAWVFIGGRIAHSLIQILTRNVRLRGAVFTVNFLAVAGLWILALEAHTAR